MIIICGLKKIKSIQTIRIIRMQSELINREIFLSDHEQFSPLVYSTADFEDYSRNRRMISCCISQPLRP